MLKILHIAELRYPGVFVKDSNKDFSFEVQSLISALEGVLAELAVSVSLFESARLESRSPVDIKDKWIAEQERRREVEKRLRDISSDREDLSTDVAYELIRERERDLDLPRTYAHHVPFIYAKSALYCLERIGKFLALIQVELRKEQERLYAIGSNEAATSLRKIRKEIASQISQFEAQIPHITAVRDSTAHIEARIKGLDKNSREIKAQPLDPSLGFGNITASVFVENLIGARFCSMMPDGEVGCIDVSKATLYAARDRIQGVIDAFEWLGPPIVKP